LSTADVAQVAARRSTLEALFERRSRRLIRRRGWLVRRALLAADVVALGTAFLASELLFRSHGGAPVSKEGFAFLLTLPIWVVVAKIYGLYDRDEERTDHSTVDEFTGVFQLVTIGTWIVYAGSRIAVAGDPTLAKVGSFWALAIALLSTTRAAARILCRRHPSYVQNTVVVGAGIVGQTFARKLLQHPEYRINLVGFVDDDPYEVHPSLADVPILGPSTQLHEVVLRFDIERVIFAFSRNPDRNMLPVLGVLADLNVQIDIVPRLFEIIGPNVEIHSVEGLPLLGLRPAQLSRSSGLLKRGMDLTFAVPALLLLTPLFVLVALAIKLDSPGPVFFRQVRVGHRNRRFRIWKFRTMVADAEDRKGGVAHLNKHLRGGDPRMFKIPNDPRMTRTGRWLRRYSLDELPQLINVFLGQMSLVGPRPLIADEHVHVTDWAERRDTLKPGITGLWQVLGRDGIPFEEMVKLDILYAANWSLSGDLKLITKTLPAVMRTADG
jgi:exopolysaccharide biosynthesis polyprenyl glycosylphosphotransferase